MIAPRRAPRSRLLKIRPRPLRRSRGMPRRRPRGEAGWCPVGLRWRRILASGARRAGRTALARGAAAAPRHWHAAAPAVRRAGLFASGRAADLHASTAPAGASLAAAGLPRLAPRRVRGPYPRALPSAAFPGMTVRTWPHLAVRWRDRRGTAERPARGGNGAGRGATGRERPYLAARVALAAAGAARAPVPDDAGRRPAPVGWRVHHVGGAAGMRSARGPMSGIATGLRQAPASPEPAGAVRRAPVRLEHVRLGPRRAGMAARGVPSSLSRHARPAGAAEPRAGRPASTTSPRPVRLLLPGGAAEATRAAALALRTDLVWRAGAHGAGPAAPAGGPAPAAAAYPAAGPAGAPPAHAAPGAAAPAAQPGRAAAGAALDPAVAERLVQDVLRRAEQRLRIDRERRGL